MQPPLVGSEGVEEGKTKNQLGTINGVYVPCLLNILGAVLFMRIGYSVGYAGANPTLFLSFLFHVFPLALFSPLVWPCVSCAPGAIAVYTLNPRGCTVHVAASLLPCGKWSVCGVDSGLLVTARSPPLRVSLVAE